MDDRLESTQAKCRELAAVSSFHKLVYSEIEELGWERLVRLGDDLSFLSFRAVDKRERVHILEIQLDKSYPKMAPSIAADVPHIFNLKWSNNSRLKDVLLQFCEHLEKLDELWCALEDIDKSLLVADFPHQSRAASHRQINLGNDCYLMLYIDAFSPRSLPECRFMGANPLVDSLRKKWRRNSKRWSKEKSMIENLESTLETKLGGPQDDKSKEQLAECGICYAHFLPSDEELGTKSGGKTDYTCENTKCHKAFHSICLIDWLQSITTTRRSYDVLFGSCPYCSEPVAVKINLKN